MTKYTVHPDVDGFMTLNRDNESFMFSKDLLLLRSLSIGFSSYNEFKENRHIQIDFHQWQKKYWPVTLMTFYE